MSEKYTFDYIKEQFAALIAVDCEPELTIRLNGQDYMVIGYEDHVSIQRLGDLHSKEIDFSTLDDLSTAETIDGICLMRDWDSIESMHCHEFSQIDVLTEIYRLKHANPPMFSNIDFLSGEVAWQDDYLQEDMLQVRYPNNYILDVGWYEGAQKFIIYIVRDFEWGTPVAQYESKTKEGMMDFLAKAIKRIEHESHNGKPYYGTLWKTETYFD